MNKFLISLCVIVFFIWLLPLGFFIKPSQEKIACNGQRAICMCKTLSMNATGAVSVGKIFKMTTSHQHENQPSFGGGGSTYTVVDSFDFNQQARARLMEHELLAYCNSYLALLEHIPKA